MKLALLVFSLFSRLTSRVKNMLYDRGALKPHPAPLPVISVGNISLGGTEKTTLAMELLARLLALGRRPALVSRGYRGRWEKSGGVVSDGRALHGTWQDAGDEPYLVARAFPTAGVYVGKDRLSSCRKAVQAGFDIAVLDDGFQHRRLARDLDIVLYSPEEKVALREPVSSLRRADILFLKSGPGAAGAIDRQRGRRTGDVFVYSVVARRVIDMRTGDPIPKEELAGRKLLAFCGIARPLRFAETLRREGLEVVSLLPFPDHHPYPRASLEKISRTGRRLGADALVTTAKDAVKISGRDDELKAAPVYVLEVGLEIEPGFDRRWQAFIEKARLV
jgi:tetraacyldisaccharide 4'-kinase